MAEGPTDDDGCGTDVKATGQVAGEQEEQEGEGGWESRLNDGRNTTGGGLTGRGQIEIGYGAIGSLIIRSRSVVQSAASTRVA